MSSDKDREREAARIDQISQGIEAALYWDNPADAVAEVREAADFVSGFNGGRGCIRDLVERVLKSQGQWKFDPKDPWKGGHPEAITKFAKLTGRNTQ